MVVWVRGSNPGSCSNSKHEIHPLRKLKFLAWITVACALHHLPIAWAAEGASARTPLLCPASAEAKAALESLPPGVLWNRTSTGYQFQVGSLAGIPRNVLGSETALDHGVIFIPEAGVDAAAYVPYAIRAAAGGRFATIIRRADVSLLSALVVSNPQISTWSLVAHGVQAGKVAAEVLLALYPKLTALALLGSVLPDNVNLTDANVGVHVYSGSQDTVVPPSSLAKFASRLPGDTFVAPPVNASHYDFAYSTCSGNTPVPGTAVKNKTAEIGSALQPWLTLLVLLQPWPAPEPRALIFADNEKLTPRSVDSSNPYPNEDITVSFSKQLIPGLTAANPPRSWYIFTPSGRVKSGLIYFPGAGVPAIAYAPIAFDIAARGHLVVLVQQQARYSLPLSLTDPDTVITKGTFPGVKHWAVGGHSQGGRTSTTYAATQEASLHLTGIRRKVYAVVLHAGEVIGNLSASSLPVLQIFGSRDRFQPPSQGGSGLLLNASATEFHEIAGADHEQVGEYGSSGNATISSREQQFIFAQLTAAFMDKHIPQ